jgi:phenylpropionate dioxygenase-like ring-hydroxylating dioxygenase large terminal subunit
LLGITKVEVDVLDHTVHQILAVEGSMFEGFARVWTPVQLASELKEAPISVQVAGVRVALFRDQAGQVRALKDQCPHRGAQLSLGKVQPDGCLACPFHGWQFRPDGKLDHAPLNALSPERQGQLSALPLPAREKGGLLWLFTDPFQPPDDEPELPEGFGDPAFHVWMLIQRWDAHWTRAMENMLDSPHLPFVHRRTIGRGLRKHMKPGSVMHIEVEDTPTGFKSRAGLDERPAQGSIEFRRPNSMSLHIPIPGRRFSINVWCIPVDDTHTDMLVVSARDFGKWNPAVRAFDEVNRLIIMEDRPVVESQRPMEVPVPDQGRGEASVDTDRFTLRFRQYYFERLKPSQVGGQPRPAQGQ